MIKKGLYGKAGYDIKRHFAMITCHISSQVPGQI